MKTYGAHAKGQRKSEGQRQHGKSVSSHMFREMKLTEIVTVVTRKLGEVK